MSDTDWEQEARTLRGALERLLDASLAAATDDYALENAQIDASRALGGDIPWGER